MWLCPNAPPGFAVNSTRGKLCSDFATEQAERLWCITKTMGESNWVLTPSDLGPRFPHQRFIRREGAGGADDLYEPVRLWYSVIIYPRSKREELRDSMEYWSSQSQLEVPAEMEFQPDSPPPGPLPSRNRYARLIEESHMREGPCCGHLPCASRHPRCRKGARGHIDETVPCMCMGKREAAGGDSSVHLVVLRDHRHLLASREDTSDM